MKADVAGVKQELALEAKRLQQKNEALRQLQQKLSETQAELTHSSRELEEQHSKLVDRKRELDQQETLVKEAAAQNRLEKARLHTLSEELELARRSLDERVSELEEQTAALAAAKQTASNVDKTVQSLKREHELELRATRVEAEERARVEIERLKSEHALAIKAEKVNANQQSQQEMQRAQEAWTKAKELREAGEKKLQQAQQREEEFDERMKLLDDKHTQRSTELQTILDAIETRNAELREREGSLRSKDELQATINKLREQLAQQNAAHMDDTGNLASRAKSAEVRLVQLTSSLQKLQRQHQDALGKIDILQDEANSYRQQLQHKDALLARATARSPDYSTPLSGDSSRHSDRDTETAALRVAVESARAELQTADSVRAELETQNSSLNIRTHTLETRVRALRSEVQTLQQGLQRSAGSESSGELDSASRLSQAMELNAEILMPLGEKLHEALDAQKRELEHLRESSAHSMQEIAELQASNESLRASQNALQDSARSQASDTLSSRTGPPSVGSPPVAHDSVSPAQPSPPNSQHAASASPSSVPQAHDKDIKLGASSLREQLMDLQRSIQHSLLDPDSGPESTATGPDEATEAADSNAPTGALRLDELEAAQDTHGADDIDFSYVDHLAEVTTARVLASAHLGRLAKVFESLGTDKRDVLEPHLDRLRRKQARFTDAEEEIRASKVPLPKQLHQLQQELSEFASEIASLMEQAKASHAAASVDEAVPTSSQVEEVDVEASPTLLASTYLRAEPGAPRHAVDDIDDINAHAPAQSFYDSLDANETFGQSLTATTRERYRALGFDDLQ